MDANTVANIHFDYKRSQLDDKMLINLYKAMLKPRLIEEKI